MASSASPTSSLTRLTWGSLLDNVTWLRPTNDEASAQTSSSRAARAVADRPIWAGFYLWVHEQNAGARAFYSSCAGCGASRWAYREAFQAG